MALGELKMATPLSLSLKFTDGMDYLQLKRLHLFLYLNIIMNSRLLREAEQLTSVYLNKKQSRVDL